MDKEKSAEGLGFFFYLKPLVGASPSREASALVCRNRQRIERFGGHWMSRKIAPKTPRRKVTVEG